MSKLKKILIIVFVFMPLIFFSGCGCTANNNNGNLNNDTTYTVKFITNNPVTFNIGPYEVKAGDTVMEPDRPKSFESIYNADHEVDGYKYIYTFIGWFEDENFEKSFTFTTPINSDINLYAKYDIRQM